MAGQALPRSLRLLVSVLLLFAGPRRAAGADGADVLLRFKDTLSAGGGGGVGARLGNWVRGSRPCNGGRTRWTGVLCDWQGKVWGLQLENMNLQGPLVVDMLVELPSLRTLSFTNNSFVGPMPNLSQLVGLKSVYLSRNKFSGEIAATAFAGLRWLKKVHLAHNQFSGPVPRSLLGLTRLLELRLDDNKFVGLIPDFRQPDLKVVNVSYNNLEGSIPPRLSKMNAVLFEGNGNLCGPPLNVSCPPPGSPLLPPEGSESPAKKISAALIISIIAIVVALLLAILAAICLMRHRQREDSGMNEPLQSPGAGKMEAPEAEKLEQGSAAAGAAAAAAASAGSQSSGGRRKGKGEHGSKLQFVKEDRPRFDLQDLLRASAEVLGSGNFGASYKAILLDTAVVVKQFKEMTGAGREDFHEHMRRLGRLSHPNLLSLVAYYYKKEEKLMLSDYVPNGSLAYMLHGTHGSNLPPLDWPTRLKIVKGVARGLAYLYEELPMLTVPHGHLKSSNVLLDESYEPLLTDYALVPLMNQTAAKQIMVAYKSPECVQSGKPSKKSDVWSLGILILEILTGKFPANYLRQGPADTDLAGWVNSVVGEELKGEAVFDSEMGATANGGGEMLKLLQIGLNCCEADVERRWDLGAAVEKIEGLRESDHDLRESSIGSEVEWHSTKSFN